MQDKITIADAPECLNTNDKAMWVLGYQAALEAHNTCLHQIQEPAPVQPAVDTPVAAMASPTFMTADQARDWAWNKVREDVGTEGWTVMDSVNYYGFFLWGWKYRAQYELQRTATRSAVLREILSAGPAAAAPVVLPEPDAWMATPVMQSGRGTTTVFCSSKQLAEQWDYGGHPEYGRMLVTRLYTEQQVRALLASAAGLPAQAAIHLDFKQATDLLDMFGGEPGEISVRVGNGHSGQGLYAMWTADPEGTVYLGQTDDDAVPEAAPQAQADAREAQLLAFAVSEIRRDEMTDSELLDAMEQKRIAVVPEYEGPWDAEVYNGDEKPNHHGSGSTPREAIRAAIAAAKGESNASN